MVCQFHSSIENSAQESKTYKLAKCVSVSPRNFSEPEMLEDKKIHKNERNLFFPQSSMF